MKKQFIYLILLLGTTVTAHAQNASGKLLFDNVESLFLYAEQNSSVIRNNNQQALLAKYEKVEAIANAVNFRNENSFILTDNTSQAVQFIPSEILGGEPGTFKEVTLGQKYVSAFNISPQIDIINPAAWSQVKRAKINRQLVEINNLLNKKTLYESIAACYFNILSFQEQILITRDNINVSDSLCKMARNKLEQGIISKQEVNEVKANYLQLSDKLAQCSASLEEQYNYLKVLCDIPLETEVCIDAKTDNTLVFSTDLFPTSDLAVKFARIQSEIAKSDLTTNRLFQLPVVSAFYSWSYNQNSNNRFFDNNINSSQWLRTNYVGVKLSFAFPDINRTIQIRKAKADYEISRINLDNAQHENEQDNRQLIIDYQKTYQQYANKQQVYELMKENYQMDMNRYTEEVISMKDLLESFDKMLIANFDIVGIHANLLFLEYKIIINNKIQ
jgi:OMF family outer membrane factor